MSEQFLWDESYSVGVQQFDSDHRRMLDLAHQLVDTTLHGPLPLLAGDVLNDLISCAEQHFGHEEGLLRATEFPGFEGHREEHRRLLEEIQVYRSSFSAGSVTAEQVAAFVAEWIFAHIEGEDRKYTEHLRERGYR